MAQAEAEGRGRALTGDVCQLELAEGQGTAETGSDFEGGGGRRDAKTHHFMRGPGLDGSKAKIIILRDSDDSDNGENLERLRGTLYVLYSRVPPPHPRPGSLTAHPARSRPATPVSSP